MNKQINKQINNKSISKQMEMANKGDYKYHEKMKLIFAEIKM